MALRRLLLAFLANLCLTILMVVVLYKSSDFAQANNPFNINTAVIIDGVTAAAFILAVLCICTVFSCLGAISLSRLAKVRFGIGLLVSITLLYVTLIALAQQLFNDNVFFLPWPSEVILSIVGPAGLALLICGLWFRPQFLFILAPLILCWLPWQSLLSANNVASEVSTPNVFLIGVDSLRPDYISNELTPHIYKLTQSSKALEPAFTPAARTYSAWSSILLGAYPSKTNARFNLMPEGMVSFADSLQSVLVGRGYKTIYGIDERRFNHIGKESGFDIVVGPPANAFEFVAAELVRVPAIGLAAKVPYLRQLFPYGYSNRAAWQNYRPQEFTASILTAVNSVPGSQPVFLAVHHTLPHWPFESAARSSASSLEEKYREMLTAADEQVGSLLDGLERAGRLNDSLVVLLSDHGESFSGEDSMPSSNGERWSAMPGHGTDLLSWPQYKVVLRLAERAKECEVAEAAVYSLVDLRWIIESCIDKKSYKPLGHAFLESSLNKMVINADGAIDAVETVKGVADLYEISNKGNLQLKPEIVEPMIKEKQLGVTDGIHLLASYPNDKALLRILNLQKNEWEKTSASQLWVEHLNLMQLLCAEYKQLLEGRGVCESYL